MARKRVCVFFFFSFEGGGGGLDSVKGGRGGREREWKAKSRRRSKGKRKEDVRDGEASGSVARRTIQEHDDFLDRFSIRVHTVSRPAQ